MKKLILLAAALATMVSCSKSESSFEPEQNEIAFKSIATRANSALDEKVKMGVYAQLGDNEYFSNAVFGKNSAGVWAGEPARYWPNTGALDFLMYAPHNTAVKMTATSITNDAVADQEDFLYGEKKYVGVAKQAAAVAVNLKHTKAAVKFTAAADVAGIYQINSVELTDVVKTGKAAIDYTTAATPVLTWTPDETVSHTFATPYVLTEKDTAVEIEKQILLVPSTQTKFIVNYSMKSNAADGAFVECPAYDVTLSGDWEAGKRYTYNIQFKGQEITFQPTVEDWNDVTSDHEKN